MDALYTYQDFISEPDVVTGIRVAINRHKASKDYKTALSADNYDKMNNELIMSYVQTILSLSGIPVEDFTVSNNKLCSNFFHRLNTQRCTYLLGNGVSFTDHIEEISKDGKTVRIDTTKELLGENFDSKLKEATYNALIHKESFGFWNYNKLYVFKYTEFVPLVDEETGVLRAGIRFWQLNTSKPMTAVLYEEDGYSKYRTKNKDNNNGDFVLIQEKKAYKTVIKTNKVDGEEVIGEENYSILPIVPLWGNRNHQSTLVGMKEKIDSFDLIRSGFANDLTDCAQVYWIISNAGGMSQAELEQFRDTLKITHIAKADTINSSVTPYSQDIPFQARKEYLAEIRSGLYEDFGGLDVHAVAAGSTNDHIDAAYQPLDEEADDLEYQVTDFIKGILNIIGVEDNPTYKRNRISNQKEQTDMILSAAEYLDQQTILSKLPFITVDEIADIMSRAEKEEFNRFEEEEQPVVEEEAEEAE